MNVLTVMYMRVLYNLTKNFTIFFGNFQNYVTCHRFPNVGVRNSKKSLYHHLCNKNLIKHNNQDIMERHWRHIHYNICNNDSIITQFLICNINVTIIK